jgi:hypothetical protein
MSKSPTKPEHANKSVELLANIAESVLRFRSEHDPTLGEAARVVGQASRLLRIKDLDERIETENRATFALMKKFNIVGV